MEAHTYSDTVRMVAKAAAETKKKLAAAALKSGKKLKNPLKEKKSDLWMGRTYKNDMAKKLYEWTKVDYEKTLKWEEE